MNYAQGRSPTRTVVGLTIAGLFQAFLIYVLVTGLGTNFVEKLRAPIETKIIKEEKPPPPEVPPPPPPPQLAAPPPPYIPPPEIQIQQPPPQQNAITAVSREAPPQQNIRPVPPAPKPAAVPDSGPSSNPTVGSSRPEYPEQYNDSGRSGTVNVTCTIEPSGTPTGCHLNSVSGGSAFGQAVMQWLSSGTARYKPAVRNGQPVAATAQLSVRFQPPE